MEEERSKSRTIIRNGCLSEQHVTLTRHATGDGVDCESDVYALCAEHVGDFSEGVLRFCDGHAVPDNLDRLVLKRQVIQQRRVLRL
jgi:hypothetical protein